MVNGVIINLVLYYDSNISFSMLRSPTDRCAGWQPNYSGVGLYSSQPRLPGPVLRYRLPLLALGHTNKQLLQTLLIKLPFHRRNVKSRMYQVRINHMIFLHPSWTTSQDLALHLRFQSVTPGPDPRLTRPTEAQDPEMIRLMKVCQP